jgi:hypothetical protein
MDRLKFSTGAFTALTVNITGTTNAVSDNTTHLLGAVTDHYRSCNDNIYQIVFIPLFQRNGNSCKMYCCYSRDHKKYLSK